MDNLKDKIYEQVKERDSQRQWKSRICEKLSRILKIEVPMELIEEILREIREWRKESKKLTETLEDTKKAEKADWWLNKINDTESDIPYEVTDEYYIFTKEWKSYPVLISTVRAIFECYSKHWKDMSSEEIRQMFKLKPWVFELIKNQTGLYKSSHIDDPVTLSRLTEDELDEHIDGKVDRLIEDKYINKYKRAIEQKKASDLNKFAISNRGYDIFLEKLERIIKLYQPRNFDKVKIPEIKNNQTRDVFITDSHIGKQWTDGIIIRFKKLTRDLIETPEKNINITFWGDLWELFIPLWEMHPWQRLWMEDITTEELVMLIVDTFENMLVELYKAGKTVTFNGMGGNHDRFTEKKEFDPYRTPAMIVYRFLERVVKNTNIKINILRDKANVIKNSWVKYVFIHWDWLSPVEINRRALAESEDWFYLVIVSWDKHNYKMSEISDKVLRIQSPALAWQGRYDKDLALSSLPWSVEFVQNKDWLVDIIVRRYK